MIDGLEKGRDHRLFAFPSRRRTGLKHPGPWPPCLSSRLHSRQKNLFRDFLQI